MLLVTKYYFKMTHEVKNIIALFEKEKDTEKAVKMAAYMRNQFPFLGVQSPLRQEALKKYYDEFGKVSISDLEILVQDLWQLKEREYHYFAMDLISDLRHQLMPSHIEFLENLLLTHSWWDTVDIIAPRHIGTLLQNYPELIEEYIPKWNQSSNLWLNRTSIIFQLRYRENTDFDLLKEQIENLKNHKDFFIRKAIAWALREYAKVAPEDVMLYVSKANLSSLSEREALKHIKKGLPH